MLGVLQREAANLQHVNLILRLFGLNLLGHVGTRLPNRTARMISSGLLIAANLLPIWAVASGHAGVGDIFVLYWAENVVVWFFSIIRIATARGGESSMASGIGAAFFFTLHYGIFTLVHGVFSFVIAGMTESLTAGRTVYVILIGAMFLSHLASLGLNWFGRGERHGVSTGRAMFMPYPRMLVMHVSIIGGFFLMFNGAAGGVSFNQLAPVILLVGLKTAIDLGLHLFEHIRNGRAAAEVRQEREPASPPPPPPPSPGVPS